MGKRQYKSYAVYDSIRDILKGNGEKLERFTRVAHGKILNGKRPLSGTEISLNGNKDLKKNVHKIERRESKNYIVKNKFEEEY